VETNGTADFGCFGATDGFSAFELTLSGMTAEPEASLLCFLEGGGERSVVERIAFSGDSSRARLRVDCLGGAVCVVVVRESILDK
jgi:hypothetical protein